jgi:hexosaminidase
MAMLILPPALTPTPTPLQTPLLTPMLARTHCKLVTIAAMVLHSAVATLAVTRSLAAQPTVGGLLPRPSSISLARDVAPLILSTARPRMTNGARRTANGCASSATSRVVIEVPPHAPTLTSIGQLLAASLCERFGITIPVTVLDSSRVAASRTAIRIDTTLGTSLAATRTTTRTTPRTTSNAADSPERYQLTVSPSGVVIHGASTDGARWGVRTLVQLAERSTHGDTLRVPSTEIDDAPRYAWRGAMLDVGRHLLPVRDIERFIDLLSQYKLNVLHWHLTEDQGWRVEIKRYPKLTSVGAWRTEADGSRYGGFYTHSQIRHLVAYAQERGVTIVPEIEMPGHSSAAVAAYPALGCNDTPVRVASSWGVFADIYCVGNPKTFEFLYGVLDEVMDLFPSPVIHIGGDEAPKDRWKACALCQAVMHREGLANEEELQSWFMRQIASHVAKRGRRVIGWDEVLDGPYIAGGLVQSWRDSAFTRIAAQRGFDVIASPSDFTYLNRSAAELTTADVYRFEPTPAGLDSVAGARVRGAEVPLWSEHIVSRANLELMALPRLLAFADRLWSTTPRDTSVLSAQLSAQTAALRKAGYAVGAGNASIAQIAVRYDSVSQRPVLRARTFSDGVVVRGTTNGVRPAATSQVFADNNALIANRTVRLQAYWGGDPVLEERRVTLVRHDAIGARVTTDPAVDPRYPGTGPFSLTDGISGSSEHGEGLWQGWWKPSVTITIALPRSITLARVQVNFLQNTRSWILLPRTVHISWSADSSSWSTPIDVTHLVPIGAEGAIRQGFAATAPRGTRARYVRIAADGGGPLPPGHPGAGQPAWLFADEVEVRSELVERPRGRVHFLHDDH